MTPQQFRDARTKLGLSARQLGLVLGFGADPGRIVRAYEAGDYAVSGPVRLGMRYLLKHGLDREARVTAGIEQPRKAKGELVSAP